MVRDLHGQRNVQRLPDDSLLDATGDDGDRRRPSAGRVSVFAAGEERQPGRNRLPGKRARGYGARKAVMPMGLDESP